MGTVEVGSDPAGTSSVSLGDNQQLKINDLVYRYGSGLALNGVNLSISSGEFVSVLGPSGCGKTTLLRLIAGFLHPTSGAILLDGIDMSERPPEKRPLNMVFQHLALFPHLSVEDNIGFSLSIQRRPKTEIRRRVADMLSLVGLSGYESRSISQLSGGQQQRVAIARAVVTEPSILLLDEPLGALDLALRKEMQTELKALQRRLGITFLFVTHDQTEAMMMSDRIVLMREGRIVQDAEPRETYDHPVNTFAATFVGDTNLFVGTIESVDGTRIVLAADGLRLVADTPGSKWHVGANTAASIRPERLVMLEHSHDPLDIPGEIEFISFLGPEVVFDVRTIAGLIKVREGAASSTTERSVGQSVHLRYAPSHVRTFSIDEAGAT